MLGKYADYLQQRRITDETTGCWNWTQAVMKSRGYGICTVGRKPYSVHRLAYLTFVGPIPHGLCVLHHCDNPRCFNPAHLFLGTQADNMADKTNKDRQARGDDFCHAKLTAAKVRKIRALYQTGWKFSAIARRFGIHPTHARDVAKGWKWSHVT